MRAPAPAAAAPSGAGRSITLAELQQSLASRPPCTVVFDIDDTALPGKYGEEILANSAD